MSSHAFIAPTPPSASLRPARPSAFISRHALSSPRPSPRAFLRRRQPTPRAAAPLPTAAPRAASASASASSSAAPAAHDAALRYPEPTGRSAELTRRTRACACVPEIWAGLVDENGDGVAVLDEHHREEVIRWTYRELAGKVDEVAAAFGRLGVKKGMCVALFAENSARWLAVDQGIMATGAVSAVRGIDAPVDELLYIYDHSKSGPLVVEDSATLAKLVAGGLDFEKVPFVVVLWGSTEEGTVPEGTVVYSFKELLLKGAAPSTLERELDMRRSDSATIIYTSGTTGHPKGVVLTHGNILAQLDRICIGDIDPLPGDVFVSVLPCWHIFERTAGYYCFTKGMEVVYSNKRRLRDDLAKHRPHVLIAVPRVFENLYASIRAKLEKAEESQRKVAFFFIAVSIAFIRVQRVVKGLSLRTPLSSLNILGKALAAIKFAVLAPLYALAKLLVWKKITAATGNRVKLCVCGGGTVPDYLEDFFEAAGITICVGYGLTETSPVICNRFASHNVRGSAGLPLPDTKVRIVDLDTRAPVPQGQPGELLVSGPQVFSEYYRDPEATDKAFDKDGFFDTGDLAYIAPDGDVVITGRSKDVIVLSNGENIEPTPIEDAILASPYIDQIVLVGQDEKHLCALAVPSLPSLEAAGFLKDSTKARIEELSVPGREAELRALGDSLVKEKTEVGTAVLTAINEMNRARPSYGSFDRIRSVRLVLDPFTVENGMLTQTLKVKRNIVGDVYGAEITELCRR